MILFCLYGIGCVKDSCLKYWWLFYRCVDLYCIHIGKKIFCQEKYDFLVGMMKRKTTELVFPNVWG